MQKILDFLSEIWNNITDFIADMFIWLFDKIFIWLIDLFIYIADLGFSFFTALLNGLSFDQHLVSAVSAIDPTIAFVFGALHFGSYIQIIFSALVTRLVLKTVIPFY